MEFRILGPLGAEEDGKQLAPSGHKARALLALLLLHANEPISADRLLEEVWGDQLPANRAKTLQIHISRLRKSLGADRLKTGGGGYALAVGDGELDRDRAVSLVERGDRMLEEGDAKTAGAFFREALSLFHGKPLEEFAYERFAQASWRASRSCTCRRRRVASRASSQSDAVRRSQASSTRSSPSTRSVSDSKGSECSRSTRRVVRRTRSRPTRLHDGG